MLLLTFAFHVKSLLFFHFLSDCKQCVRLNGDVSDWSLITSGGALGEEEEKERGGEEGGENLKDM